MAGSQECFGAEGVLHVMQELQAECDTAGSRVLRRYLEHRRLQRLVKEIGGAKHRAPPVGSPERSALVDPLQVESFLDEIVMVRLPFPSRCTCHPVPSGARASNCLHGLWSLSMYRGWFSGLVRPGVPRTYIVALPIKCMVEQNPAFRCECGC